MTTDSDKCSFSSILPMSCRGRAEAFARRLHSRLRSLGSEDGRAADENSWLAGAENPVAVSQPRHSSDSDLYFDFSLLDSPGSPEEEIPESELVHLITNNKDNLHLTRNEDCYCSKPKITAISLNSNGRTASPDSDSSDGQYFDPDTDDDHKVSSPHLVNGSFDGYSSLHNCSAASEESALSLTVSDEDSTLDLQDCPSLEYNSFSQDLSLPETDEQETTLLPADADCSTNLCDNDYLKNSSSVSRNPGEEVDPQVCDDLLDVSNEGVEFRREAPNRLDLESTWFDLNINDKSNNDDVDEISRVRGDEKPCNERNGTDGSNRSLKSPETLVVLSRNKVDRLTCGHKDAKVEDQAQSYLAVNGLDVTDSTQRKCESTNQEESYCSTLRIENNLTVDFDGAKSCESALINKVEVNIEPDGNDADDHEEPIPRVRRCSSLKTGKTPPGTPGRKKIVRFADVLGLDLADVRTFLDEVPKVPNSAYSDLLNADLFSSLSDNSLNSTLDNNYRNVCSKADRMLVPLFQQPGGQVDFLDRVRENQVCLENVVVDDLIALSVRGMVRVRNLDFNKSVHIRYSLDSWKSYSDLQAVYVLNSCDGFSDKFSFLMYANAILVGQRLEFAVRFQCKGCQYWDSNNGANYAFQCLPTTNQTPYAPITGADDHWGATFYYADRSTMDSNLRQTAVQEYITTTLGKNKKQHLNQKNPDLFTVLVVIIFSIVFLYIQRAIYFT